MSVGGAQATAAALEPGIRAQQRTVGQAYLEDTLDSFDPRLLESPEGRRELTRLDPLLFALVYLSHHLKHEATGNQITLSEFHVALYEQAVEWVKPLGAMGAHRDAYIAPRDSGKSTLLFLILPMWAAAHGHERFIAAFSDSATQAEQHLATFRYELDRNEILRADFPTLCEPAKRTRVARELADNRGQIQQANGFVFMARGIDSSTLGMKVGASRPTLLLLDDIEKGESNYSAGQVAKRLATLQDVVLPLNLFARVVLAGTVTMAGSLVHQLVRTLTEPEADVPEWVTDDNWVVHHHPALITSDDGSERSIWPEKWPLEDLQAMRHTRSFAKNMQNLPLATDGDYWQPEDITIKVLEEYGATLLTIDPAVTSKTSSDQTGLAVISRGLERKSAYVREAVGVRLPPARLRAKVITLLERFEEITLVLVETNQGGEVWHEILHDLPVKIRTVHQTAPKHVRAQRALNHYQRGRVFHTKHLPQATEQMLGFPDVLHDDVMDAVVTGVNHLLKPRRRQGGPSADQMSYV